MAEKSDKGHSTMTVVIVGLTALAVGAGATIGIQMLMNEPEPTQDETGTIKTALA